MRERFVSEAIKPVAGTMDTSMMATGEPGLPMRFVWRGDEYAVDTVLEKWKETGGCKSGGDERYVRKHWFRIRAADGSEMQIYCDRKPRTQRTAKSRWWLFTIQPAE